VEGRGWVELGEEGGGAGCSSFLSMKYFAVC